MTKEGQVWNQFLQLDYEHGSKNFPKNGHERGFYEKSKDSSDSARNQNVSYTKHRS